MVNLLGSSSEPVCVDLRGADHVFVHLYGKTENRAGRKMGHVTAVAGTTQEALSRAQAAAARIRT